MTITLIVLLIVSILSTALAVFFYFKCREEEHLNESAQHRTQFAEALVESFHATAGGVNAYTLNKEFEYTYLNKAHRNDMKRAFGVHPEKGMNKLTLIPPLLSQQYRDLYQKALDGSSYSHTQQFGPQYITFSFSPIYLNKEIQGISVRTTDTTEEIEVKKEVENYRTKLKKMVAERSDEVLKQRDFFQQILDELPNHLVVRDGVGNQVLQGKPSDIYLEENWSREDEAILVNGEDHNYETEGTNVDGKKKWLFINKRRISIDGTPHVLSMISDITHLKTTQQALEQSNSKLYSTLEKLKNTQLKLVSSEKMASVTWVTSGLMHEINNAINYVAGSVDPLQKDFQDVRNWLESNEQEGSPRSAEIVEILDESSILLNNIEEGADRVKKLVSNLKAFAGTRNETSSSCDINDSLKSILSILTPRIEENIKLIEEYGDVTRIYAISTQLGQVFLNVLENAIESIEDRGTIKIRTFLEDEDNIVEIIDSGSGVPSEHQYEIFDPFFTTKGYAKSGLGLAITKRMLTQIGGTIELRKGIDQGACFRIVLPVTPV